MDPVSNECHIAIFGDRRNSHGVITDKISYAAGRNRYGTTR